MPVWTNVTYTTDNFTTNSGSITWDPTDRVLKYRYRLDDAVTPTAVEFQYYNLLGSSGTITGGNPTHLRVLLPAIDGYLYSEDFPSIRQFTIASNVILPVYLRVYTDGNGAQWAEIHRADLTAFPSSAPPGVDIYYEFDLVAA